MPASSKPIAFVVLRHTVGPALARDVGDHFDWLFDAGADRIPTWSAETLPRQTDGWVDGLWLPPHRRHYLTYEGPVSNDRGRVDAVLRGDGCWLSCERCKQYFEIQTCHVVGQLDGPWRAASWPNGRMIEFDVNRYRLRDRR